jgi:hypothetical protein
MILSKVLVLFKKKKKGLKDLLPISQLFQTKTGSYTISVPYNNQIWENNIKSN